MLLAEIAQYLENLSLGSFDEAGVTGDIFINSIPSSPDQAVILFPTGGFAPDARLAYDFPSFQVRVRGPVRDPRPAISRAQSIISSLHGLSAIVLPSGTFVVSCMAEQSSPIYLGMDSSGRHEYTCNFTLDLYNPGSTRES